MTVLDQKNNSTKLINTHYKGTCYHITTKKHIKQMNFIRDLEVFSLEKLLHENKRKCPEAST